MVKGVFNFETHCTQMLNWAKKLANSCQTEWKAICRLSEIVMLSFLLWQDLSLFIWFFFLRRQIPEYFQWGSSELKSPPRFADPKILHLGKQRFKNSWTLSFKYKKKCYSWTLSFNYKKKCTKPLEVGDLLSIDRDLTWNVNGCMVC